MIDPKMWMWHMSHNHVRTRLRVTLALAARCAIGGVGSLCTRTAAVRTNLLLDKPLLAEAASTSEHACSPEQVPTAS